MGLEGESTIRVKIQPAAVSTKRERNPDPADSGKKVVPGVEWFRFFCGLAQRRGSLFFLCPRPFRRSAFPEIRSVSFWDVSGYKGNVLRGFGLGIPLIFVSRKRDRDSLIKDYKDLKK